jgi:hypothetical protein
MEGALPLWQSFVQHQQGVEVTKALHRKSMAQALRLHEANLRLDKEHHLQEQNLKLELLQQQSSRDQLYAQREGIRDAWGQRNQLTQSMVVVNTLVFGSSFATLVSGAVPQSAATWIVDFYFGALCASLLLLFLSTILFLKTQSVCAGYEIKPKSYRHCYCGVTHNDFNSFFTAHCATMEAGSRLLFYGGTTCTILSAAVLWISKVSINANDDGAGILFGVIVGVSLLFLWISVIASYFDDDAKGSDDYGGVSADAAERQQIDANAQAATTNISSCDVAGIAQASTENDVAMAAASAALEEAELSGV